MLDDIARKRDRKVVAEAFFTDLAGQGGSVFRGDVDPGERVARVENAEQEFVALVAVFAQQG